MTTVGASGVNSSYSNYTQNTSNSNGAASATTAASSASPSLPVDSAAPQAAPKTYAQLMKEYLQDFAKFKDQWGDETVRKNNAQHTLDKFSTVTEFWQDLLSESNPTVRRSLGNGLKAYLDATNFKIPASGAAREAIDWLREVNFDVVANRISNRENMTEAQKKSLDTLLAKIEKAFADIKGNAQERLDNANTKLSQLEPQKANLDTIKTLLEKLDGQEDGLKALKKESNGVEGQIKSLTGKAELALKDKNKLEKDTLAQLKAYAESLGISSSTLEGKSYSDLKALLFGENGAAGKQRTKLQDSLQNATSKQLSAQAKEDEWEAKYNALPPNSPLKNNYKAELLAARAELAKAKQETAKANAALKEFNKDDKAFLAMVDKVDDAADKLAKLSADLDKANARKKELDPQIASMTADINDLSSQINSLLNPAAA
jgi:chromosome segregation ATPase